MEDLPEIRIGTAEREEAMRQLSDHFSAGRLSVAEFDDRSGSVAAAQYRSDLAKVFADLPEPVPTSVAETAKADAPARSERGFLSEWPGRLMAAVPIIAFILFLITHSWVCFLLIPLAGALFASKRHRD